jgi:hypothetical protein
LNIERKGKYKEEKKKKEKKRGKKEEGKMYYLKRGDRNKDKMK